MTTSTSATKKCSHKGCEVIVAIPEGKTKRNAVYCSSHVKATPVVADAVAANMADVVAVVRDLSGTTNSTKVSEQDVPAYIKEEVSAVQPQTKGETPMTEAIEIVSLAVAQTLSATKTNKGESAMNKVNEVKDVVVEKAVNLKDSSKEAFAKVTESKAASKVSSAVAGTWDFIKNVAKDAWGFIRDNGMTALASSVSLVTGVAVGGGFVSCALVALSTYVIISVIVALAKRERLTAEFFAKSVSGGLLFPVFLGMVLPQLTVYGFLATLSFFA